MRTQQDDSPLYVFDGSFDEENGTQTLLKQYSVPRYFCEDLFRLVGADRRPPYRWFLIGPKRSGTRCVGDGGAVTGARARARAASSHAATRLARSLHVDPLGTSAWNTLISGVKR